MRKAGNHTPLPKLDLAAESTATLCKELANPIAWHRETAQRLLFERKDKAAIPLLKTAIRQSSSPMQIALALQLLDAFSALDNSDLQKALTESNPFLREVALQLAAARLADTPILASSVLQLANDPDSHVRFQCALTVGSLPQNKRVPALASIGWHAAGDRWIRAAHKPKYRW